ncbi:MAG: AFG1/ZapE family ATPase [Candidatus Phlomobacter fragariae]
MWGGVGRGKTWLMDPLFTRVYRMAENYAYIFIVSCGECRMKLLSYKVSKIHLEIIADRFKNRPMFYASMRFCL